ncbi:MAG: hypothetical protein AAF293_13995 [Pseudomonadota bacterium]
MIHLLRSLIAGYAIALAGGFALGMYGWGPVSIALTVWISGSFLSVLIAGAWAFLTSDEMMEPIEVDRDYQATEFSRWDADKAAERFAADLAADLQDQISGDRRSG